MPLAIPIAWLAGAPPATAPCRAVPCRAWVGLGWVGLGWYSCLQVGDKSFRLYATSHLGCVQGCERASERDKPTAPRVATGEGCVLRYGLKEAYNTYAATGSADCTVPADADATAAHRMLNRTFVDCQSKVLEVLFGTRTTIIRTHTAIIRPMLLPVSPECSKCFLVCP